jgi:hypothetical protein
MNWGGRMPKQVTLNFDWEPSVGPNGEITFYVRINRTRISIALWLERLRASQLEDLHGFLAARHAGIDNAEGVLRMTLVLLTWSFQQHDPSMRPRERLFLARETLLQAALEIPDSALPE